MTLKGVKEQLLSSTAQGAAAMGIGVAVRAFEADPDFTLREKLQAAYDKSREQSKHPFFAGQRLRRLVRELLNVEPGEKGR